MENNNLSKYLFKEFLKLTHLKKRKGNRQIVDIDGENWQFSLSTKDNLECRQLYEDCEGFITFHIPSSEVYVCRVENPYNHPWSRTTRDGISAFSVEMPLSLGVVWDRWRV